MISRPQRRHVEVRRGHTRGDHAGLEALGKGRQRQRVAARGRRVDIRGGRRRQAPHDPEILYRVGHRLLLPVHAGVLPRPRGDPAGKSEGNCPGAGDNNGCPSHKIASCEIATGGMLTGVGGGSDSADQMVRAPKRISALAAGTIACSGTRVSIRAPLLPVVLSTLLNEMLNGPSAPNSEPTVSSGV